MPDTVLSPLQTTNNIIIKSMDVSVRYLKIKS